MKVLSLALRSVVLFSLLGLVGNLRADARLILVDHTQPKAVIVIGSNPSEQARQAATEQKIADVPAGKARLYLPEVRGSAIWVWCNGDFAGYGERTKSGPREIALASALRAGDNTLTFRVKGEGTLPPFLFSPVE